MSITVVGSVALDTVETPFGKMNLGLGGAASHFSVAASFFTKVNLVGVVGDDFPQEHILFFKSRGIDLQGLEIVKGGKSFFWQGRYDHDLNTAHNIATHLNVFASFAPKLPLTYKDPEILFLAAIHPKLQAHVAGFAGKPRFVAVDTRDLWIDTERQSLLDVLTRVNMVLLNEGEARLLTGEYNLVKAAKVILRMGPQFVVIKRGEYGCLLFSEDNIFHAPAYPLEEVFDPTGAGDSFAGGLLGYLDRCAAFDYETMKTATICGATMASFIVEKFSCDRLREIGMADIQRRFLEFKNLGKFETMMLASR